MNLINLIDQQTLVLGGSLLGLVIINIILGSITSWFKQQFDKAKFWQGLLKGVVVTASFVGVCYIGRLTPNIIVINVNGQDVSLYDGTYLLMLSSYLWYSKECLVKLSSFVSGKYKIDENKTEAK
jgi:mannose/fructose/N-acetylgalactosamine-specific phosphotransferase system component IID